jgi:hypothetical protein
LVDIHLGDKSTLKDLKRHVICSYFRIHLP